MAPLAGINHVASDLGTARQHQRRVAVPHGEWYEPVPKAYATPLVCAPEQDMMRMTTLVSNTAHSRPRGRIQDNGGKYRLVGVRGIDQT